jgi:hypothetical protein
MDGTTRRRSPGRKDTPQTEPNTKLPRSVAEVLEKHFVLEVEGSDRMYLNALVPRLQITEGDSARINGPTFLADKMICPFIAGREAPLFSSK